MAEHPRDWTVQVDVVFGGTPEPGALSRTAFAESMPAPSVVTWQDADRASIRNLQVGAIRRADAEKGAKDLIGARATLAQMAAAIEAIQAVTVCEAFDPGEAPCDKLAVGRAKKLAAGGRDDYLALCDHHYQALRLGRIVGSREPL